MSSSSKNPGTETFDRIQRWAVIPIVIVSAVLAIWRNDVSWALLPVALVAGALFLFLVMGGAKVVREWGISLLSRRKG